MTIWDNIFFNALFLVIAFIAFVLLYATVVLNKNYNVIDDTLLGRTTYEHIRGGAIFHLILAVLLALGIGAQKLHIDLDLSNPIGAVLVFSLLGSYLWMVIGLTRHAWLWAGKLK